MGTATISGDRMALLLRQVAADAPLEFDVSGLCMEPLIRHGARVSVEPRERYRIGDVIAFRTDDREVRLHRLIGRVRRAGQWAYVMCGDSMRMPDRPVPAARIIGALCGGACDPRAIAVPWMDRLRATARFPIVLARLWLGRQRAKLPA